MKKINIRRLYYRLRHKYFTLNNVVILVAFLIAAGWVWGSLNVMQRNYALQKSLENKKRELIIAQLDTESAELEQRYYKTSEYKELAVRDKLGLALPGESVIILPVNSEAAEKIDETFETSAKTEVAATSNFTQWMNFLFGGNSKGVSSSKTE